MKITIDLDLDNLNFDSLKRSIDVLNFIMGNNFTDNLLKDHPLGNTLSQPSVAPAPVALETEEGPHGPFTITKADPGNISFPGIFPGVPSDLYMPFTIAKAAPAPVALETAASAPVRLVSKINDDFVEKLKNEKSGGNPPLVTEISQEQIEHATQEIKKRGRPRKSVDPTDIPQLLGYVPKQPPTEEVTSPMQPEPPNLNSIFGDDENGDNVENEEDALVNIVGDVEEVIPEDKVETTLTDDFASLFGEDPPAPEQKNNYNTMDDTELQNELFTKFKTNGRSWAEEMKTKYNVTLFKELTRAQKIDILINED